MPGAAPTWSRFVCVAPSAWWRTCWSPSWCSPRRTDEGLRHPVDLEHVGAQVLPRQPGGDPDQLAALGNSLFLGQPGALVQQGAQAGPVLGERAADSEQQAEPAHGFETR